MNIDKVLKIAKDKGASDVHLIFGLKPMLRIARELVPVEEADELTIDDLNVQILGVKNPEIVENAGNEQSMVIKFQTPQSSLLILGDTGVNSSEKLLNTQKEKLNCDIVQMAHHGQSGATKELYTVVSPKICLWPTPAWLWDNDPGTGYNTGNWKTIETRKWMEELGVQQNYVEKDGDVTIKF